jgi:aryl-alcohol dehydrogenase-like predicted oxidoreductase
MSQTILPKFLPRRALGRTGFVATAVGAGDLADRSLSIEECAATLRAALDAGLNLVDTAPGYEDGYSEQVVGCALKGRREGVFVVDKIDHLDRPVAPQVEGSLKRLGMDQADLFLFHGVSTLEAWQGLAAEGGGFDQLVEAIRQGKGRFAGISSHHPEVLRRAIESGRCDVVMFALGPYCDLRYVEAILPLARARGVGTIGFKAFGAGKLLGDTEGYGRPLENAGTSPAAHSPLPHLVVRDCVHYILTVDPDVALLGMSSLAEMREALTAAAEFRPLAPPDMADIRRRAELAVQGKGRCWWNPP